MIHKKTVRFMFIVLLFSLLTACGGTSEVAPTAPPPDVPPTTAAEEATEPPPPTAVPEPAAEPTTEPEPTAVPEPTAEPEPTAVPEPIGPSEGPDLITIAQTDLFPEGIEYDVANGRFLISSLGEGTVYAVNDDGTFHPFIEDDALISSVGLEIDAANNRLLVANTANIYVDPSLESQAYLGIYDLTTGERLDMIDLIVTNPDSKHFANDIAIDGDGNIYVTDSQAGVVKVDTSGNVTAFASELGLEGTNGIAYHPDGYLIIPTAYGLYKVPVDNPASGSKIDLGDVEMYIDGMVWDANGNLVVLNFRTDEVVVLNSDDNWETAVVEYTSPNHPASTLAVRGEQIYALYPHFEELYGGGSADEFEIVLVAFNE